MHLIQGDCLEIMKTLPDASIDLILCDLPYGTTACKWDSVIPLPVLWSEYKRILRDDGAVVLTATDLFAITLASSNLSGYRYSWIWNKQFSGNFVQAKRMPLRIHEQVVVFSFNGKTPRYFPQMTKRDVPIRAGRIGSNGDAIPNASGELAKAKVREKIYDEKYPTSVLEFSSRIGRGLHPTQKPVALMEYLIRTYTNKGDTVLDNCMGSGTTGVACANLGRDFIGIEKDEKYFQIAQERIGKLSI